MKHTHARLSTRSNGFTQNLPGIYIEGLRFYAPGISYDHLYMFYESEHHHDTRFAVFSALDCRFRRNS